MDTQVALNTNGSSTTATLWLAYCSNNTRTVAECVKKTQEILTGSTVEERELIAEWLGRQTITAYLNRGNDASFVAEMFTIDDARLALGCVETALSIHMRGAGFDMDVQPYMTRYATRYGESIAFLTLKLRWITLYPHYTANVDEAERIMQLLTNAIAKNEVA